MPKFSIIVPIYNVEEFLRECIESILRQTFRDFELILVDDGSPDHCGMICDEYALKDERIRVIHKRNGGLSDARNAGLDLATGKYIYFLDGDDYVHPDLLDRVNSSMESDTDLLVFHYWEQTEDGKTEPFVYNENRSYALKSAEDRYSFLVNSLLTFQIGWAAWNRVFLREKIEKYNLRFADNRKIFAEDLYFSLCYCAHVEKIKMIDDYLYYYRVRTGSITDVQKKRINIGRYNELGKAVLAWYSQFEDCGKLVKDFCTIHYMIVARPLMADYNKSEMSASDFREALRKHIDDWDFFVKQMKRQLAERKNKPGFSRFEYLEQRCYVHFFVGGSNLGLRLRTRLLYLMDDILHE